MPALPNIEMLDSTNPLLGEVDENTLAVFAGEIDGPAGDDTPFVCGTVNGVSALALLDTETQSCLVSPEIVEQAGLTIDRTDPKRIASLAGTEESPGFVNLIFKVQGNEIPLRAYVWDDIAWDAVFAKDAVQSFSNIDGQFDLKALDISKRMLCRTTYLADKPELADQPNEEEPKLAVSKPAELVLNAPDLAAAAEVGSKLAGPAEPEPPAQRADEEVMATPQQSKTARPSAKRVRTKKGQKQAAAAPPTRPTQLTQATAVSSPQQQPVSAPAAAPLSNVPLAPAAVNSPRPATVTTSGSGGKIELNVPGGGDAPFVVGTINDVLVAACLVPSAEVSAISLRIVKRAGLTIDETVKVRLTFPDGPPTMWLGVVYAYMAVGRDQIPLMMHVVDGMF
ncbi:hypothetical protein H9P43_001525 [Blastocladiella emersonii ATCC 22665]|nr:hypothetical protein H9P43_001525 [Blastocladiella emersonii ATCC 22665]